MAIRVLVGHRGALLREALRTVLSSEPDLDVVAELARGDAVLSIAVRQQVEVAILDALLPDPADVRDLCARLPSLGILLLLERDSFDAASLALARLAPRVGLIATDTHLSDFFAAVRQLARGEPVLDVELAVAALTIEHNPLTDREQDVLRLAETGAPARDIADTLHLSLGTVRNYLSHILAKTGARTRIEAIRIAHDAGWI